MVKKVTADGEVVDMSLSQTIQAGVSPFVLPRAPGLYDPDQVSDATAYRETMPSLTEQSEEPGANINTMIERLGISQVVADGYGGPFVSDLLGAPATLQEALNRAEEARSALAALPARVRSRFGNDAEQLLEFLERSDEEALDEAVDMGLIKRRPKEGVTVASEARAERAATPAAGGAGKADSGAEKQPNGKPD